MVKGKRDRVSPLPPASQQEQRGHSVPLPAPVAQHLPPPSAEKPEDQVNKLLALLSANPRVSFACLSFVDHMLPIDFILFPSSKRPRLRGRHITKTTRSSPLFQCLCARLSFRAALARTMVWSSVSPHRTPSLCNTSWPADPRAPSSRLRTFPSSNSSSNFRGRNLEPNSPSSSLSKPRLDLSPSTNSLP